MTQIRPLAQPVTPPSRRARRAFARPLQFLGPRRRAGAQVLFVLRPRRARGGRTRSTSTPTAIRTAGARSSRGRRRSCSSSPSARSRTTCRASASGSTRCAIARIDPPPGARIERALVPRSRRHADRNPRRREILAEREVVAREHLEPGRRRRRAELQHQAVRAAAAARAHAGVHARHPEDDQVLQRGAGAAAVGPLRRHDRLHARASTAATTT